MRSELRAEFSTMTGELLALRDWLMGLGVTHVAMEATGVYWKPVYYLLEDDFELLLVNAQHVKNVPGRKTDVQDAQWLCRLLEHGLLRASFVPPKPVRELRDLTRYRKSLVWERQREANRLQKLLEDANIKLGDVASDVLGASGRAMLRALCEGETDPEALAELAKGKLRAKLPALRVALEGRFREHHALLVSHLLSHIDYLDETIDALCAEIEQRLRPFERKRELLCTIPGVAERTAEVILAEFGHEMKRFPSLDLPRFGGQVTARRLPSSSSPFSSSIARSCWVRGIRASSAAGAGCTRPRSTRRSRIAPRASWARSAG